MFILVAAGFPAAAFYVSGDSENDRFMNSCLQNCAI